MNGSQEEYAMNILFFECNMGAAGDMLTAALYELLDEDKKAEFIKRVNSFNILGCRISAEKSVKCGITGTHMKVMIDGHEEEHYHDHLHGHDHDHTHEHEHEHEHDHGHHHHSSMQDICALIDSLDIPKKAAEDAKSVYKLIAEAESTAHDRPVSDIHFHEVGTKDAVIDVVSVCLLIDMLRPDKILSSPVHVGSGTVRCMHGILPVPAPATAHILKDVPIYGGKINGELTTPTGAALLKHFVSSFGDMPVMSVKKTGYGMGTKDFENANCVRAFMGYAEDTGSDASGADELVAVLSFNVDDMTGEAVGFAYDRFFEAGAYEAFSIPVNMKKSRPGLMIEVICDLRDVKKMVEVIFKHTTTIGIRRFDYSRYTLERSITDYDTPKGVIRRKEVSGYGISRFKYEYEDLSALATKMGISLKEAAEYADRSGSVK